MRVAYLITAYNDVPLLNTLLDIIVASGCRAFVHVDVNNNHILEDSRKHSKITYIENAISVSWGGSDITEASIRLIDSALSEGGFDYLNCLSGSDLPVRPLAEFHDYLRRIHPRSILAARPLDMSHFEERKRIAAPYFLTERTRIGLVMQGLAFLWGAHVLPRRPPDDAALQFGSSWFTVTAEAGRFLARKWRDPAINAFYRRCYCAEEIFIPTYPAAFAGESGICRDRIRYVVWPGGARPKTLTTADAADIAASGCYFARKFDSETSRDLIRHFHPDAVGAR